MLKETDFIAIFGVHVKGARLIGWQFAADGTWDCAEKFSYTENTQRDIEHIACWLKAQTTTDIAFEALFKTAEGEPFFFGTRITPLSFLEKNTVAKKLLTETLYGEPFILTIGKIRQFLRQPDLALKYPDYLELGVVDLWNRVKSLVVWEKRNGMETLPAISAEDVSHHSPTPNQGYTPLHEPQCNPLILEAVWRPTDGAQSLKSWVSLPVSTLTGPNRYALSPNRYLTAIQVLSQI